MNSYGLCVLRNEGKNLWKKPSMQVTQRDCDSDTQVSYDWCNNNERIMRTTGLIQHAEELQIYNHKRKYFLKLSPCIVFDEAQQVVRERQQVEEEEEEEEEEGEAGG